MDDFADSLGRGGLDVLRRRWGEPGKRPRLGTVRLCLRLRLDQLARGPPMVSGGHEGVGVRRSMVAGPNFCTEGYVVGLNIL